MLAKLIKIKQISSVMDQIRNSYTLRDIRYKKFFFRKEQILRISPRAVPVR